MTVTTNEVPFSNFGSKTKILLHKICKTLLKDLNICLKSVSAFTQLGSIAKNATTWASYLTPFCLNFLISKIGIIIPTSGNNPRQLNNLIHVNCLE